MFDLEQIGKLPTYTRFDLPTGAPRLYADAAGIDHVFVNGTEIYRRPIGSRFARHEVAIPEGAVRKGTNDLELRSVARLEFPVGSTGVQLGARLSAVAGKGHVSIDLDGRAEASSQLGYRRGARLLRGLDHDRGLGRLGRR